MGPKKEAPRRGSTNTSSADAQYLSTEQSSSSKLPGDRKNLTKHRVVQHGIWSPAGAGTRIIYAANSDAGCSLDGQRKTNQDSFVISVPDPKGKTALFGVFDGHGENGHLVSRNCIAQFPTMYQNALTKRGDPSAAVKSAYIELDQHCNGECDCSQSGTTAVTSYFTLEKEGKVNVQTAWAGDSRAVMGSAQAKGAMTSTDLSDDHKPDRPDEMARIQRAGGIVEPVFDENGDPAGPHRVWYLAQVAPGLAMGRSIGDAVGAMVGVTAEPEIANRTLKPEDALCVIASDGLWEFLSSAQVIQMATQQLRKNPPVTEKSILDCAIYLSDEARKEWLKEDLYVDDITVIVLIIQQMAPTDTSKAKPAAPPASKETGGGKAGKRGAVSGEATTDTKDTEIKKVSKGPESMAVISKAIKDPRHLIFQGMADAARTAVAECMFEQKTTGGESIIKQGETGDVVYVVETGKYDVFLEQAGPEPVLSYSAGDSFGELALMYSSARAATVKCVEAGRIWGLDRVAYKKLVKQSLEEHAGGMGQMIKKVDSLKDLDAQQVNALIHSIQIEQLQPGQALLKNAKTDSLYIVRSGAVELTAQGGEAAALGVGSFFGEGALVGDGAEQRAVTVTATEATDLLRITHEAFVRHVGALQEIKRELFNVKALSKIPDLKALTVAEVRQVAKVMTLQKYSAGAVIAKQGASIANMHIIHSGTVEKSGPSKSTLGEGEIFGDAALFGHASTDVTLTAQTDVLCMVASKENVTRLIGPLGAILEREQEAQARKAEAGAINLRDLTQKKILGIGTFGVVRLVVTANQAVYALKAMRKDHILEMGQTDHLLAECKLLAECDHPFIVRLVRLYEDKHRIYLLQDPMMGGELFSVLRNEKYFPERRCVFYSAMLVLIFEYLHNKNIIYRDLKPENLLFDKDGYLKLVDFGFAKRVEDRTWTVCGTPEYMAPEIILNKGHNKAVDWWTVGIIQFEMLVGFPPFEGNDPLDLYKTIVANQPKYPKKIGPQSQEIISAFLTTSPADRLGSSKAGAEDVKKTAFFKKIVAWQSLATKKIEAPYKPPLKDALDVSNFDEFDDPETGDPPKDVPKGKFDEFAELAASFNK